MKLVAQTAPYIRKPVSVKRMMLDVIIALMPVTIFACIQNGWSGIYVFLISIATMLVTELVSILLMKWPSDMKFKELFSKSGIKKVSKIYTVNNFTAPIISALIYALIMPAGCNWYVVFIGALFGILVGKMIFGGLGSNIFNPAAVGRVFVGICFGSQLLYNKGGVDVAAGGTPLAYLNGNVDYIYKALANYKLWDLFLGQIPGSMGEVSSLMIIIGAVYLFVRRSADVRSTLSMLGSFAVVTLAVSIVTGSIAIVNPILLFLYEMLSGGLLFGAVFMITDPVTSPTTKFGRVVAGVMAGSVTALIRYCGAYPEGVAFSILIVNMFVPTIDHLMAGKPRNYSWKQLVGVAVSVILISTISSISVANDLDYKGIKENKYELFESYHKRDSNVVRNGFQSEYIIEKITVCDEYGNFLGYIYTTRHVDNRGSMVLMIGIDQDYKLTGVQFVVNDQSYAPMVADHVAEVYVKGLDLETIKGIDTACGATSSALKVQNMVVAAFEDCIGGRSR